MRGSGPPPSAIGRVKRNWLTATVSKTVLVEKWVAGSSPVSSAIVMMVSRIENERLGMTRTINQVKQKIVSIHSSTGGYLSFGKGCGYGTHPSLENCGPVNSGVDRYHSFPQIIYVYGATVAYNSPKV